MKLPWVIFIIFISLPGCVDPVPITSLRYDEVMVIEGYISSDNKQHQIKVSKTSPLGVLQVFPETGATVTVDDGLGNTYAATESSPGIYLTSAFPGVVGRFYQLHIVTNKGKSYQSESVRLKDVPDIGSVYATYPSREPYAADGIQIYVDSPNSGDLNPYYRWEYEYTYEIQTPVITRLAWLGGNNVNIRELPVDRCWHSDTSRSVLIRDNSHLSEAGVKAFPIRFIPAESRDPAVKFSILVKQYPLDEQMFRYWDQLKKINEGQGTLADIQPGIVKGNVSSVDTPDESVLGYFDAGVVKSKRVFFLRRDFESSGFYPVDYFGICNSINPAFVPFDKIGAYMTINASTQNITSAGVDEMGAFYVLWPKTCCDCTQIGTNVMPDFWQ